MKIGSIATANATQFLRRGGEIALWFVFIGVVYALAQRAWLLAGSTPASAPASEVKHTTSHKHFEEGAVQMLEQPVPAPHTTPGLVLAGVLTVDAAHGSALIVSDSGQEKTFFVGDTVYGGAKLKAVYADRVLLESERGLAILKLRTEARVGNVSAQPAGQSETSVSTAVAETAEYFIPATSATGELIGFRLSPNVREPGFQQWGLLADDIIVAVHGLPMLQPENRARAMQRLRSHEFASLTIIRDRNKLINITIMNGDESKSPD